MSSLWSSLQPLRPDKIINPAIKHSQKWPIKTIRLQNVQVGQYNNIEDIRLPCKRIRSNGRIGRGLIIV